MHIACTQDGVEGSAISGLNQSWGMGKVGCLGAACLWHVLVSRMLILGHSYEIGEQVVASSRLASGT